MKGNRVVALTAGLALAIGLAAPAFAGDTATCDATIEINALRGGSPAVSVPDTKNITAKARILKGTGPADQTVDDTTLTIEAYDASGLVDSQTSGKVLTLVVGKGGQGDKLGMIIDRCDGGVIDFYATFTGTDSVGGGECSATSDALRKTCK